MKKITVIIPVYNAGKYVRKCVDSLISQTIEDIEILIINDASTDDTYAILSEYVEQFTNIKVVNCEKNSGQAYARNLGMKHASGKYIYFMDADDWLSSSEALQILFDEAEKSQVDCLMFSACAVYEDAEAKEKYATDFSLSKEYTDIYNGKEFFQILCTNGDLKYPVWMQFWKRDFLLENHISFDETTSPHEDILFTVTALLQCNFVKYINKELYSYLVRVSSSSRGITEKRFKAYVLCWLKLVDFCREQDYEISLCEKVLECMIPYMRCFKKNAIELMHQGVDVFQIDYGVAMYKILLQQYLTTEYKLLNRLFTLSEYERLESVSKIVIYGAGVFGKDVAMMLEEYGFDNYVFAVSSDLSANNGTIQKITDFFDEKENVLFIVAASSKYSGEMKSFLESNQISNYISFC